MFIINWLETAVSWILVAFHSVLGPLLGAENGWSWVLSIVGLVIVIRILLIPLFVKQIKAQRNMQLIQPQMKEIQKKYAGDRERQSQEMMKLYRETGTNPLASCLPILLQAPIFFALFRVLQGIAMSEPAGVLTREQTMQAHDAAIFGVPIYGTFMNADETPSPVGTRVLAVVLILLMSATTFITQRQLIIKNTTSDNPMAKQLKIMMYVFPVFFAIGGFNFPIGVLIYWTTTNIWSMGQQFWVIRNNPSPGTPAHDALTKRRQEKAARKAGLSAAGAGSTAISTAESAGDAAENQPQKGSNVQKRQQPKRQARSKRAPAKGGARPAEKANPPTGAVAKSGKPQRSRKK